MNVKVERITSQKKIILDYLKNTKCHPSAESVYSEVKKKLPRISKGTVYRILKNLKEKGKILEIPSKVCRYDGCTLTHMHFFCEKCGEIIDVFEEFDFPKLKKLKVGKIKNYQISIYGICKKCKKAK